MSELKIYNIIFKYNNFKFQNEIKLLSKINF